MIYWITFLFGSLIGSFLNVCIVRIPEEESIVTPRSHCPHCQKGIRFYDNIPLLSFIFLRGRCRDCRHPISWQYPLIEFLTGALAVLCLWKFPQPEVATLWFLSFICPLLVVSFIDLKHFLIPDSISLPFILVGLGVRLILTNFAQPFGVLQDSFLGILIGAGGLFLVGKTYELIQKREGIGRGDVKLMAMIGAFLGWKAVLFVFLLSSFLGSLVGVFLMIFRRFGLQSQLPYGPFLSLAAVLQLFWGISILNAYFSLVKRLFSLF